MTKSSASAVVPTDNALDDDWTPAGMLSFAVGKAEQKKESELRRFLSA